MSKGKIAIIAVGVVAVLAAVAFFVVLPMVSPATSPQNNTAAENATNASAEPLYGNSNTGNASNSGSIANGSTLNSTTTTIGNSSNTAENEGDQVPNPLQKYDPTSGGASQEVESNGRDPYFDTDPEASMSKLGDGKSPVFHSSGQYDADRMVLDTKDKEKAKQVATDFLQAFYTYTPETLSTGSYTMSFSSMVAPDSNSSTGSSQLIYVHSNPTWYQALGTYPHAYSALTSQNYMSLSIAHTPDHNGEMVATIDITVDRNQGAPGDYAWDAVNTYKIGVAVYLNDRYEVTDVREQTSKALNINIFGYNTGGGQ